MSDDTATQPEPAETDHETERIHTLDSIAETLAELKAAVFGGGSKKADAEPEPASVGEEVKRELARLKAAEDRKKSQAEKDAEIAGLKETVKKLAEKPPKEYRKITHRIWGSDE